MEKTYFQLKRLELKNFRNLSEFNINLDHPLIFFTGENGSGKTSILEAISIASMLKSFRSNSWKDLVAWGKGLYTIDLLYSDREGDHNVHVGYHMKGSETQKSLIIDSQKKKRISDFIGKFHTVTFSPNDVQIIDTNLSARRSFVDMILSVTYRGYLENLQSYRKLNYMRSLMLRRSSVNNFDTNFFHGINAQMAESGSRLQKIRIDFFKEIQEPFQKYVKMISGGNDQWVLNYRPSIEGGEDQQKTYEHLEASLKKDIRLKYATSGIHRDQIRILFANSHERVVDIKEGASQGQKRTVALALKMAQFEYTISKTGNVPVLLVDDVLHELDVFRREKFIDFLDQIGQALITTTDLLGMETFIEKKKKQNSIQIYTLKKDSPMVVSALFPS